MSPNTLLDYTRWANQEVISTLLAGTTPRATKLMAHIVAAEMVWLSRIRREPQPIAVWPEISIEECSALAADLPTRWRSVLEDFSGEKSATEIPYVNTQGDSFTSTVEQMILQVVTHAAYHRGQIASELRAAGLTPPSTDFIVAARQGHLA